MITAEMEVETEFDEDESDVDTPEVDDDEMAEILAFEDELKKGIDDIENGRYRIVG